MNKSIVWIQTAITLLFASTIRYGAEIKCIHHEEVKQASHQSYDYVTEYEVAGSLKKSSARLNITSREYYLKLEGDTWVVDYSNKGNVHVDVDQRSIFNFARVNGDNKVYTSKFASDRTGVYQYNLAFIVTSARNDKGEFKAIYSKSSQTDDAPFHEKISLSCKELY
jgi:hypothetical protein